MSSPLPASRMITAVCSRLTNGPATIVTLCYSAIFGIWGPTSSISALVVALLIGHTSAE